MRYRLPAGDYTMYLLTDGAPVNVTLHLHGLTGRTTVRPTAVAGFHLSEATGQDATDRRYQARDDYRFRGLGMIVMGMLTRSETDSHPEGGFCIVRRHPEEPDRPTDSADGPSSCASRVPAATVAQSRGDYSDNFHGGQPGRGITLGGGLPAGDVKLYSSFDPGTYRVDQFFATTPLDNSQSFTAAWLSWS